jgi:hypothetical protein
MEKQSAVSNQLKTKTPNPLPCGCGVYGTQQIDVNSGRIYYENQFVKHCDTHANAETTIAALAARVGVLRDAYHKLWTKHGDLAEPTVDEVEAAALAQADMTDSYCYNGNHESKNGICVKAPARPLSG